MPTKFPTPVDHFRSVVLPFLDTELRGEELNDAIAAIVEEHNEGARAKLKRLTKATTQGEWLALTRLLDKSRQEIADDGNLTLLALAYVDEKRRNGRASLELLLELNDEELLTRHDFVSTPDDDELEEVLGLVDDLDQALEAAELEQRQVPDDAGLTAEQMAERGIAVEGTDATA